jgi:hypothetical protein
MHANHVHCAHGRSSAACKEISVLVSPVGITHDLLVCSPWHATGRRRSHLRVETPGDLRQPGGSTNHANIRLYGATTNLLSCRGPNGRGSGKERDVIFSCALARFANVQRPENGVDGAATPTPCSREPIDRWNLPVLLTSLSSLARARNAVVRPYLLDVSSSPLHSRQSLALDVYHFESCSFWVSSSHLWMETERKWMTLTSESFTTLFGYFSLIYTGVGTLVNSDWLL